jgi:hypothetical protein
MGSTAPACEVPFFGALGGMQLNCLEKFMSYQVLDDKNDCIGTKKYYDRKRTETLDCRVQISGIGLTILTS